MFLDVFFEIPRVVLIRLICFSLSRLSLGHHHQHHYHHCQQCHPPIIVSSSLCFVLETVIRPICFPLSRLSLGLIHSRTTSRAFSSVLSSSRASASPKKLKQLCLCISNKIALMFLVLLHRPKNAILSQKKVVVALVHVRKKKALRLHLEKRMYLQKNQEEHSDLQLPRTAGHSR